MAIYPYTRKQYKINLWQMITN